MNAGVFFIHSHPHGRGWQGMSEDDEIAERRLAPAALAATSLPLVGLTMGGGDFRYSARRWQRAEIRVYHRQDAESVRVVGDHLSVSLPPRSVLPNSAFDRTELVWGKAGREVLTRLRLGIVGLGSVGSVVGEISARTGIERLTLVDGDRTELLNLDRTLNADKSSIGEYKCDVAAIALTAHAPASIEIKVVNEKCDNDEAYAALLDCDFIFCCVDRPWARRILNQLSYANAIPISNGGLLARMRKGRFIGADWHVHTVGPTRRCLQCWKAFDQTDAALDRDGLLDDPSYVKELDPNSPLVAHANAMPFAMNVASLQFMQFAAMVLGPIHNLGDCNFHAATGTTDVTADPGCLAGCVYSTITGDPGSIPPLKAR